MKNNKSSGLYKLMHKGIAERIFDFYYYSIYTELVVYKCMSHCKCTAYVVGYMFEYICCNTIYVVEQI